MRTVIQKLEDEIREDLANVKRNYDDRVNDKEDRYGYREEELGKYRIKIMTLENVLVKFNRLK